MYTAGVLIREKKKKPFEFLFFFLKYYWNMKKSSSFLKNKPDTQSTWHSFLSGRPHFIRKWKEEKHWKEEPRKSDLSKCTAWSSGCPGQGQRQQHILPELSGSLELGTSLRRNPMLKYWQKNNQVLLFNLFLSTQKQADVSSCRNTGVRCKDEEHSGSAVFRGILFVTLRTPQHGEQ